MSNNMKDLQGLSGINNFIEKNSGLFEMMNKQSGIINNLPQN